jgi:glutamate synthase (ferredoxin)
VTPEYLVNAEQLEIKIAQGAKPGEGGELPGRKVTAYVAELRNVMPGTTLISPPPHHDIYSIEDLAQLIYDLRQINPDAEISVKLVAATGVGTIAAGVAKAGADVIHISGYGGGTAAALLNSIKHAGMPWELGIAEAHRTLLANGFRDRVRLRVDGDLRTGRDVLLAALLGADEFAFGTAVLLAEGCVMDRVCHLNKCPVGIATQDERLRQRFAGEPQHVVNYFGFVAGEVRMLLAGLGYRSFDEIVGRSDLLERVAGGVAKTDGLDPAWFEPAPRARPVPRPGLMAGPTVDERLLADDAVAAAIAGHGSVERELTVTNVDRAVGARLAGEIARRHGDFGFGGSIRLRVCGSAGQSLVAFLLDGLAIELCGEANDYVGKGMAGGEIVLTAPPALADPAANVIAGNTCLYGATGGELFAHGRVGERFAVRNSGARAVVEGAGDHCCEYMTGGVVVVLGPVGRNACAGMTGGTAFFLCDGPPLDGAPGSWLNATGMKVSSAPAAAAEALLPLLRRPRARPGRRPASVLLAGWPRGRGRGRGGTAAPVASVVADSDRLVAHSDTRSMLPATKGGG